MAVIVNKTLDYQETYSRMGDDELLRLSSQWNALTERAQIAFAAELDTRKLSNKFKPEVQAAVQMSPIEPSSQSERIMFALFIVGLPASFILPRVWPESMQFGGLYDLLQGLSMCFPLWMIVWVVLRARRIQRMK